MLKRYVLAVFAMGLWGCGGTGVSGSIEVEEYTGAPSFGDIAGTVSYEVEGPVLALGLDDGTVLVGGELGLSGLFGVSVLAIDVYSESGEPLETGAVSTLTSRASGILVAGSNGLFHTQDSVLVYSPMSVFFEGDGISSLSVVGEGDDEKVWIAAESGLYYYSDGFVDTVTLEGESGSPSMVVATDGIALVAYEGRLYELNSAEWTFVQVPGDLGTVHQMAEGDGALYAATDKGLLVRSDNGSYSLYTLGGVPVHAVAFGPVVGAVALVDGGLVGFDSSGPLSLSVLMDTPSNPQLTIDDWGNVWLGDGSSLTGYMVGDVVSFETDVKAILEGNCNSCHLEGIYAPKHDFGNFGEAEAMAEAIVARTSTGQMPPGGTPLQPEEDEPYETLVRWYTTGMNP